MQSSSCPSRQLLIQKYAKMTAVDEANSSLAIKCLDFCQALTSQGLEINFSLNIGSTFSFSLDTRHKVPLALDSKKKKKASPSTLRRNARRRRDFLKKKRCPAAVTPISSATAYNSVAATNTTRNSDPPAYHHEDPVNALLSPGAGGEPFFTELSSEVEVPPNYVPSPPFFVQPVEVVGIGSFQELTPSVRGTMSTFATVVVDIPSLSHHLM